MKRILCLFLILCLSLSLGVAFAQTTKEEVIYATLDASGAPNALYAVNIFNLDAPDAVTDYGAYSAIKTLTSLTPTLYDMEATRFSAEAGRFYYQGDMLCTALPWLISIQYTLDGAEILPEKLAGASGHLEIAIDIQKNGELAGDWYDNLMCQVTVTLPFDCCKNILAPNAVSANAGESRTLAFSALPGQGLHGVISLDAENFEMSGVSIAALPFAMDFALPDVSGYTSQIASLGVSVAGAASAAEDLGQDTSALKTNAQALADAADAAALRDRAQALKAGADEPTAALIDELLTALDTQKAGAQTLAEQVGALDQKLFSLRLTTAVLARGTSDLPDQVAAMMASIAAEYDYSAYQPASFTDERNGTVKLLQFVMTTDPIRVAPETPVPETQPESTLLTRLLDLFGVSKKPF